MSYPLVVNTNFLMDMVLCLAQFYPVDQKAYFGRKGALATQALFCF